MAPHFIQMHANAITRDTAAMEDAFANDDRITGEMILEGIKFRKKILVEKHGVVIV